MKTSSGLEMRARHAYKSDGLYACSVSLVPQNHLIVDTGEEKRDATPFIAIHSFLKHHLKQDLKDFRISDF